MPLKPKSKKRGSKSASFEDNFTGSENDLGNIVLNNAKYFGVKPPVDDDEAEQRIIDMFTDCFENNSYPTVEKLALCLGTARTHLWEWEKQETKGKRRSDMIKQAKEIIASIDAEAVSLGMLNHIAYIFRAQNYYGLTNDVTVEHKVSLPLGDAQDQSTLAATLLRQLQGQGQAIIDVQPQNGQATIPATIAETSSDYSAQGQATIASDYSEPSDYPSDYQPEEQATFAEKPADPRATMPSDFEPPSDYETGTPADAERLSSDYAENLQATFNPLTALGKALAEELTPSDGEPGGEL